MVAGNCIFVSIPIILHGLKYEEMQPDLELELNGIWEWGVDAGDFKFRRY